MYIIIIGCGRFGGNLAKDLSDEGNDVCIIDRNGDKLNSLGSGFNGQRIKGIEFDSDNLAEAGVERADALIAVTPDDNVNITVSMIADKIFHVPQIIARVNDPEKNYFYHKLGINTINPIRYEIEIAKSKLLVRNIDVIAVMDDNYELIELPVKKEKTITVGDLEDKFQCVISGILRLGAVRLPRKNDLLESGDRIFCTVPMKEKWKLINFISKENFL